MEIHWRSFVLLAFKLFILSLFLSPFFDSAMALDELFEIYSSPQGLLMGNAMTSDAQGHVSNYYNPAGLAKASKREWEIIPVALEATHGIKSLGYSASAQSLGIHQVAREMKKHPGDYYYNRVNFLPAVSKRGFGIALLGSYQNAGRSDGTNFDAFSTVDLGGSVGTAANLAGNLLKFGFAAKVLLRNQLNGTFDHSTIDTEESVKEKMKEGLGAGADFGLLFTFPNKYLPTFALVWRDILNTQFFSASHTLNRFADGKPDPIQQSINAAFSIHPYFSRRWKGTFALEFKHFERTDLSLRKRFHLGFQLADEKSLFFWAGLNQLYWTAGLGLRLRGGNLELGTYGVDVGQGNQNSEDRRIVLRYTIGF